MTKYMTKAPEQLLAGEILELFASDVLVASTAKITPYALLEDLLAEYCTFLGVRQPSSKQLGAFLTLRYPKVVKETTTFYQVGINPTVVNKEGTK